MTTSVILPTYNEGLVIVGVVREILDAVTAAEVLVVDDDSPDRTWRTVEEAFAGDGRVRVLRRIGRRGRPRRSPRGSPRRRARRWSGSTPTAPCRRR